MVVCVEKIDPEKKAHTFYYSMTELVFAGVGAEKKKR